MGYNSVYQTSHRLNIFQNSGISDKRALQNAGITDKRYYVDNVTM